MGGNGTLFLANDGTFKDVGSVSGYVSLSFLENNYYDLNEMNNLYYTKQYINDNYYNVLSIQQILNNYALSSSLNNYVLTSFLTNNYKNNTELASILLNYALINNVYDKSYIDNILNNYALSSSLNNYVLTSFLSSNYTNNTDLTNLLNNKVNLSSYNTDIGNINTNLSSLNNKFFTPISSGNLKKSFFEYADLTSTKYILFSQNGSNQYQTINFIDDNSISQSKVINLTTDLTSINNNFNNYLLLSTYNTDNVNYTYDYAYNNYRDQLTGLLKINVFVPPSSNGNYYLSCVKTPLLNTFSW